MKDKLFIYLKSLWKPLLGVSLLAIAFVGITQMRNAWLCDGVAEKNAFKTQLTLAFRADVDCTCDGKPLIFTALANNDKSVIDLLYEYGADLDRVYYNKQSPLTYFIQEGNAKAVKTLLNLGANPNHPSQREEYPLFLAINSSRIDKHQMVQALVDYGAGTNGLSKGSTPLTLAAKRGDVSSLDILLKNKANPHSPDNKGLLPIIHSKDEATANFLAKVTDLDIVDKHGNTLAHVLVDVGMASAAWVAIDRTNLFQKNRAGLTPLMRAAKKGNDQVFNHLLKQGANFHALDNKGRGIAYYAKKGGSKSIQGTVHRITAQAAKAARTATTTAALAKNGTKQVARKTASKTAGKMALRGAGKQAAKKVFGRLIPGIGTAWMAYDIYNFLLGEEEPPQKELKPTQQH